MKQEYFKWYSPHISRDFEMMTFGHAGYPVILFPTTMGHYYEYLDFKVIESARWFIEQGLVKIYCPDSMDKDSWYNKSIHPADRVRTHNAYENVILHEIIHRVRHDTGVGRVALGGASFGGYHAANFAFRNPAYVSHLFSMSGAYDIKSFMDGYYDDNVYFNNPMDYVQGLNDPNLWNMHIVLGIGEHDICRDANERMSHILHSKNVNHWLDVRQGQVHDWPVWRDMFPHYLSQINFG